VSEEDTVTQQRCDLVVVRQFQRAAPTTFSTMTAR
jgi:hypothetical protein